MVRRAWLFLFLIPQCAWADVVPAKIFGDHMVLQRDEPVPIWGKAAAGEEVKVHFLKQTKTTKADAKGEWKVVLDPLTAGGPHELSVVGANKVVFADVLVGEVWVCSGQSNMQWSMKQLDKDGTKVADSANPMLRLNQGAWQPCDPKSAIGFSATGYYFGKDLQKALGVPVGLINRSVGGTSARLWTSKAIVESDPSLKPYVEDIIKGKANVGGLYTGLIRPLIPYAIRGVIWYQGESDASRPEEYAPLFKAMIRSWRSDWGQGDFPFLFVHLGAIGPAPKTPDQVGWGPIREAQSAALALPRTAVAAFHDSEANLHPRDKDLIGRRLALVARERVYGEKIVSSGPTFDTLKIEGDKAIVRFKNVGGGLVAKGDIVRGFALAGEDAKYVWADAKIVGDTVVLSSRDISRPVSVRYAFASNPQATLYNREGLPALPFRTSPK